MWLCRCECGNERPFFSGNLKSGRSKSCGCLHREIVTKQATTHGQSKTPIHAIWLGIIVRCEDKNHHTYPRYGGRGITICERWRNSFEAFLADVGNRPSPDHSIDRIDNNKGYEPGNVRWATQKEQCRNTSKNRIISIDGVSRCVAEWAEVMGFPPNIIHDRLRLGWNERDAVLKQVNQRAQSRDNLRQTS